MQCNLLFCYKSAKDVFFCIKREEKKNLKCSDTKQLDLFFFSSGDNPVNAAGVSMESSQFSSEVLVTQVNIIMFTITFLCFIYICKLSGSDLVCGQLVICVKMRGFFFH